MRILHIGKYYPPFSGGIENFMAALLPDLCARGFPQAALVHQHHRGLPRAIQDLEGICLYRTPIWGKLIFAPVSPRFPADLAAAIRDFKPDLMHIHTPNASAFWALSSSFRHIPIVVHWHADVLASEFHVGLALAYPLYRPLEQKLLERASAIIVTSPPYRDSSPSLRPWLEKCHVIPLGLGHSMPAVAPGASRSLWKRPERFKILSVGRLTYYKGHEFLIRATAGLQDVEVVIVGSGARHGKLEKLIQQLGLQERVRLFGPATEAQLRELMRSCDCFCLPSIERTEAFGLVLLEAMRAGKPSVVTDVLGSGMSWVIEDEVTGLVAKRGDEESLRTQLIRLRDDLNLRESLGTAAGRRFTEDFTIRSIAPKVIDLSRQVLRDRTARTEKQEP